MSAAWDVVVVGGRAAGASTAMLLARAGLRVLCVERTRLGSDTLSTHALMRGGTLQLAKGGLPAAGYEWFYGPRVRAGVIPTNGGFSCVFVGAPPARLASLVQAGGPGDAVRVIAGEWALGERLAAARRVGGLRYMRAMPGYL